MLTVSNFKVTFMKMSNEKTEPECHGAMKMKVFLAKRKDF